MRLSPMVRKSSLPSRMFASTSVDPDPEPVKRFCTMSSTLCATLASVSPVPPGACGKLRVPPKLLLGLSSAAVRHAAHAVRQHCQHTS